MQQKMIFSWWDSTQCQVWKYKTISLHYIPCTNRKEYAHMALFASDQILPKQTLLQNTSVLSYCIMGKTRVSFKISLLLIAASEKKAHKEKNPDFLASQPWVQYIAS